MSLSRVEKLILDDISTLMFKGGCSPALISALDAVVSRAKDLIRVASGITSGINSLPNEILMMIFDYLDHADKALIKFTCYSWMILLHGYNYEPGMGITYNSETILDWICDHISDDDLRRIKLNKIMKCEFEHTIVWFLKNVYFDAIYSLDKRAKMFRDALDDNRLIIAKYLYSIGESRIRIKAPHFDIACNNNNYEMFVWLDEASYHRFYNTHKLMKYHTTTNFDILRYAKEHGLMYDRTLCI